MIKRPAIPCPSLPGRDIVQGNTKETRPRAGFRASGLRQNVNDVFNARFNNRSSKTCFAFLASCGLSHDALETPLLRSMRVTWVNRRPRMLGFWLPAQLGHLSKSGPAQLGHLSNSGPAQLGHLAISGPAGAWIPPHFPEEPAMT